jgi:hypothetical protein
VEKASQIQKMKRIYERASRVIAWLGVSADNSDLVVTTLHQIDKHHTLSLKTSILSDIAKELGRVWDETKVLSGLKTALSAFAVRRYWMRL